MDYHVRLRDEAHLWRAPMVVHMPARAPGGRTAAPGSEAVPAAGPSIFLAAKATGLSTLRTGKADGSRYHFVYRPRRYRLSHCNDFICVGKLPLGPYNASRSCR